MSIQNFLIKLYLTQKLIHLLSLILKFRTNTSLRVPTTPRIFHHQNRASTMGAYVAKNLFVSTTQHFNLFYFIIQYGFLDIRSHLGCLNNH